MIHFLFPTDTLVIVIVVIVMVFIIGAVAFVLYAYRFKKKAETLYASVNADYIGTCLNLSNCFVDGKLRSI